MPGSQNHIGIMRHDGLRRSCTTTTTTTTISSSASAAAAAAGAAAAATGGLLQLRAAALWRLPLILFWSGCGYPAALAAAASQNSHPAPFDYPGAGFQATLPVGAAGLGYPALVLEGYPTWSMQASTAAYFLGNDTGLNNAQEMAAESKFGVVGLGWQLAMRATNWSHLEATEMATAAAIKAINPSTKVLVSRNVQVGGIQWDSMRSFFLNFTKARASQLWCVGQAGGKSTSGQPRCEVGQLCNGSWGCPNCGPGTDSIPYGQLRFNWSSPAMRSWWLHTHLHSSVSRDNIDGVHFDCECGDDPGIENLKAFDTDALAGFAAHIPVFRALKKFSVAWHSEHVRRDFHNHPRSCQAGMMALAHYSTDANQTFQLGWDNEPATFNQTLAAFLILRGPSALFAFDVVGPYECASSAGCGCDSSSIANQGCNPRKPRGYRLGRWSPLLELDFGKPLSLPVMSSSVWSREWSKATVSLNCSSWQATFVMKANHSERRTFLGG